MKNSKRARRAGVAVGLAAAATMAFGASSASAAPMPFANTFDNSFLKTTFPGNGFDILDPVDPPGGAEPPASIAGTIDLAAGGEVVIPAGCDDVASPGVHNGVGFCFPDFSGTVSGIPISVSLDSTEPLIATPDGFPVVTGGVTAQSTNFDAVLNVAGVICTISDMPLQFSTADTAFPAPYDGDLFDVPFHTGMDYPPLQNGAIQASWSSLPAATPAPGDDCSLVNGLTGGPGGLWIAEGLSTPAVNTAPVVAPPPPGGGLVPQPDKKKPKKCKKGFKKVKKKGKVKCKKVKKKKKK